VSDDGLHRGFGDDCSIHAFAVKHRAFGAPRGQLGFHRSARSSNPATVPRKQPKDAGQKNRDTRLS
jgi:hypothetical protein